MAKTNTPKPWERQEGETPKPYEAFCIYRDMKTDDQERSLREVANRLKKSLTLIGRWSSKYSWVERVAAWDDEQERIEREIAQKEQAKAIREMRKRQAQAGYALQLKATKALGKLPIDQMSPQDIVKMMAEGAKLERIGRGDVGEVVEERDGGQAAPAVTFYMPSNGRDEPKEEGEEEE